MSAIQQNGGLFENLIKNYEEALRKLLAFMYQQTITAHGQVETPSASIEAYPFRDRQGTPLSP